VWPPREAARGAPPGGPWRAPGHGDEGRSIERIAALAGARRTEVALAVLAGAEILEELEAARGQAGAELARVETEGPALLRSLQGGEEPLGARKRLRPVEHAPVHVGEEEAAPACRAADPAQHLVDRLRRQVVRDALPDEERALAAPVACLRQRCGPGSGVEVGLHEGVEARAGRTSAQPRALGGQRGRAIELEDASALQRREAPRAAVEAGAEQDHLRDPVLDRGAQGVVDEAGPGDAGRARAGPAPVDQARHEASHEGRARGELHRAEARSEESARERILEEARLARAAHRLESAE